MIEIVGTMFWQKRAFIAVLVFYPFLRLEFATFCWYRLLQCCFMSRMTLRILVSILTSWISIICFICRNANPNLYHHIAPGSKLSKFFLRTKVVILRSSHNAWGVCAVARLLHPCLALLYTSPTICQLVLQEVTVKYAYSPSSF